MNARARDDTTRYSRSRAVFARRSRAAPPRALAIARCAPTRDSRDRARASRARRAQTLFSVSVDQSFRGAREISRVRPIVSRLCIVYVRSHVYNMRSGPSYIRTPTRDRAIGRPRASPMAVIAATPRS
jgi:hypothetical protein